MAAARQNQDIALTGKKKPMKKARTLQADVSEIPGPARAMTSPIMSEGVFDSSEMKSNPRPEK